MKRLLAALVALIACAAPALAQVPKLPTAEEWAKVMAAAKQEGSVSFYTSFLGAPFQLAMIRKFEQQTGIKVNLFDARPTELEQRIRAEYASNRHIIDLYQTGPDQVAIDDKDGFVDKLPAVPNMTTLRPDFAAAITALSTPSYILPFGLLVNTDLVRPADEPKSWLDLADPKWRGKLQSDDLRVPGSGQIWFSPAVKKFGRPYMEAMAQQKILFDRNIGDDEQRVARGEFAIRWPEHFGIDTLKGLPVKLVVPKEGASYVRFDFALMKGATHPNAAAVMMNYYLSQEFQVDYANGSMIPVAGGIEDKINPDKRALAESALLGTSDVATRDADMKAAKEIFK